MQDIATTTSTAASAPADGAAALPPIAFDNTYARELDGFYVAMPPARVPSPRLVWFNTALADELGLDAHVWSAPAAAQVWAGNVVPDGAQPIAQAYAGHQFGGFSAQLGDGRALLLGEVIDRHGQRRDIAFKGSGRTPFSRGGDGKAVLGAVLREVIVGEAMHALGIPTTRALAAATTGEQIVREGAMPGAVLTRVASSHLRVGTFEFFAARGMHDEVRRLLDYAVARHDPDLIDDPERALKLLARVVERQAALIARWMGVGFIHGVMNTDNMTISGETIDYGPCAFLEAYDPDQRFSSIDHHGRYAFGRQPSIAQWNLARLAETLLPLIQADSDRAVALATEVVEGFAPTFEARVLRVMRAKFGLDEQGADNAEDALDRTLVHDGLALLHAQRIDHTSGFRRLNDAARGAPDAWLALFEDAAPAHALLERLRARWSASAAGDAARQASMRVANPAYIARNHRVEAALEAAVEHDDLAPMHRLLAVLAHPFDDRADDAAYAQPAPPDVTAGYRTYCGT
jgi:serine/tyrosine/threonine adenylyltransferase